MLDHFPFFGSVLCFLKKYVYYFKIQNNFWLIHFLYPALVTVLPSMLAVLPSRLAIPPAGTQGASHVFCSSSIMLITLVSLVTLVIVVTVDWTVQQVSRCHYKKVIKSSSNYLLMTRVPAVTCHTGTDWLAKYFKHEQNFEIESRDKWEDYDYGGLNTTL